MLLTEKTKQMQKILVALVFFLMPVFAQLQITCGGALVRLIFRTHAPTHFRQQFCALHLHLTGVLYLKILLFFLERCISLLLLFCLKVDWCCWLSLDLALCFCVYFAGFHTCAIGQTGLVCFGDSSFQQNKPPTTGNFVSLSAGYWHTWQASCCVYLLCFSSSAPVSLCSLRCSRVLLHRSVCSGLLANQSVVCWGGNQQGQAPFMLAGPYVQLDAGYYSTCFVNTVGKCAPFCSLFCFHKTCVICVRISCIGKTNDATPVPMPVPPAGSGPYQSVHVGGNYLCGLLVNGTLQCWSSAPKILTAGTFLQAQGPFVFASAGTSHGRFCVACCVFLRAM